MLPHDRATAKVQTFGLLDEYGGDLNYQRAKALGLVITDGTFRTYKKEWRKGRNLGPAQEGRIPRERSLLDADRGKVADSPSSASSRANEPKGAVTPRQTTTGILDVASGIVNVGANLTVTVMQYFQCDRLLGYEGAFGEWLTECVEVCHQSLGLSLRYLTGLFPEVVEAYRDGQTDEPGRTAQPGESEAPTQPGLGPAAPKSPT